ncbi:MAG: chemotaxis protein CheW, partial [Syntrophorhabdaceae bacterium]|nr:chemotaxis protein CheW [Syntrophorhabdaceae bacterium]
LEGIVLGFIVDSVSEVLRIPSSTIEPPPSIIRGIESEFIEGVGKLEDRLLILLELKKIFSTAEHKTIEEMELN